jgi:hypothetical protein
MFGHKGLFGYFEQHLTLHLFHAVKETPYPPAKPGQCKRLSGHIADARRR